MATIVPRALLPALRNAGNTAHYALALGVPGKAIGGGSMDRKARHNCRRDLFRLTAALAIMLGLGGWTAAQAAIMGTGSTTSSGGSYSMVSGGTSTQTGQLGQPGMFAPQLTLKSKPATTAMPELPAWVLLAAGLALLGLVTRRRSAPLLLRTASGADSVTDGS